jgi:hypothetical protein
MTLRTAMRRFLTLSRQREAAFATAHGEPASELPLRALLAPRASEVMIGMGVGGGRGGATNGQKRPHPPPPTHESLRCIVRSPIIARQLSHGELQDGHASAKPGGCWNCRGGSTG